MSTKSATGAGLEGAVCDRHSVNPTNKSAKIAIGKRTVRFEQTRGIEWNPTARQGIFTREVCRQVLLSKEKSSRLAAQFRGLPTPRPLLRTCPRLRNRTGISSRSVPCLLQTLHSAPGQLFPTATRAKRWVHRFATEAYADRSDQKRLLQCGRRDDRRLRCR